DGNVDGRDFLAWQRGTSTTPLSSQDLPAWQENYGSGEDAALGTRPLRAADEDVVNSLGSWIMIADERRIDPSKGLVIEGEEYREEHVDRAVEHFATVFPCKPRDF